MIDGFSISCQDRISKLMILFDVYFCGFSFVLISFLSSLTGTLNMVGKTHSPTENMTQSFRVSRAKEL